MHWRIHSSLLLSLLAQVQPLLGAKSVPRSYDTHSYYALEHDPRITDASLPDVLAHLGVELVEQVGELRDHWLVRAIKPAHVDARDEVLARFEDLQRRANSLPSRALHSREASIAQSVRLLERQTLRQRVKRAPPPIRPGDITAKPAGPLAQGMIDKFGIKDPLFSQQWHLVNEEFADKSLNVTGVWDMGITGKGVITSFIDDGVDYTSLDLKDNFLAEYSYNYNDHEDLPTPKLFDDHHGTRCAGQVAAGKNDYCGTGIAYESKVCGSRILSGPISDVDEAASLNLGYQNVSIYSCSWGPPDNGQTMEGPTILIKRAMVNGVENGRDGKGSIFVFASGNGAASGDQCNFDGYTNSIYSITVSAIDYKDLHPYYSEPCAANLIVAYSSGGGKNIVTTDRGVDKCSSGHGGTSAAAPNAAGVIALALEVRPDLTWRDVQHIAVNSAKLINPKDPDWERTHQGRLYSYKYGFGAIDAYKFVTYAKEWNLVKPQSWFHSPTFRFQGGHMNLFNQFKGGQHIPRGGLESKFTMTKEIWEENNLERLEHINVKVWIDHHRRGDVEVALVSPNGVVSVLAGKRSGDAAKSGYPGWTFMTVKHWDENPIGDWTIRVWDQGTMNIGRFLGWNMIFWGECIDPSKTTTYDVPIADHLLPPPPEPPAVAETATTIHHAKPTAFLPGDHDDAEGENSNAVFTSDASLPKPTTVNPDDHTSGSASDNSNGSTNDPTADEGWFKDMGNLNGNQKWFFGALALVLVFSAGACIWLLRRRSARRRQEYSSLPDDDVGMSALRGSQASGGRTTKELYDAFGEVSDDEADEETRLRPEPDVGLGYHEGFLDDDEPGTAKSDRYRDEPDKAPGSPSGSGDGSWEHASS
ncbi:peptidase S8/S53 domain-containing protein [Flagelloscypha sp. PMI_526]|nr:peptidase S8/S53 domain-containing protein [Flagelloscypha sp. PMI_526]